MDALFKSRLQDLGLALNENQYKKFLKYYEMLVKWNEKINLTAITDQTGVFEKHFVDSLSMARVEGIQNSKLLDVGSGAGFPSIPLKIMFPEMDVTIIDALNKRILFLQELTKELGIEVNLVHGRAEEFKKREYYDIVTARAVANLTMLAELCVPFVKIDGKFIAMKGSNADEEVHMAKSAMEKLDIELSNKSHYILDNQDRYILEFNKTKKTKSIYPRKFNKIKNNPL
jgi:16S rRNA (guanine527-N7)-methyltransferase